MVYLVGKVRGSGVAGGLSEPDHRLTAGALRRAIIAGEPQEHRPDGNRVREGHGEYRLFPRARVFAGGEAEQEVYGVARRGGAEIGGHRVWARSDPACTSMAP